MIYLRNTTIRELKRTQAGEIENLAKAVISQCQNFIIHFVELQEVKLVTIYFLLSELHHFFYTLKAIVSLTVS